MAEVVLVHGIGKEKETAKKLEQEYFPALARGVTRAERADLATRIWREGEGPGDISCRVAFYGRLFLPPEGQGANDNQMTPEQEALAEEFAEAIVRRAIEYAQDERDRSEAQLALRNAERSAGEAQGMARDILRWGMNALCQFQWFAIGGMALAQQFVWGALAQVTKYLTDDEIRTKAQREVFALCGPETKVLIGHSLGSVIAYEVAHQLDHPVLLVTLGSPLGLRHVIYERTRPQPASFPPRVHRWVNVADREDLIAAIPDLGLLFPGRPGAATFESGVEVKNGAKPHSGKSYLESLEVGQEVAAALAS
jgi:hypothetical protein